MQAVALAGTLPARRRAPAARPAPDHAPALAIVAPDRTPSQGYAARKRPNLPALFFIGLMHAALLFALIELDVVTISKPAPQPLVVELLSLPNPPPPAAPPPPEQATPAPEQPTTPAIVIPKAEVITSPTPAPVTVTATPALPRAVIVAPPAPSGPISVADLDSKLLSAPPPRYPVPSLRLKEQGTVILSVLVGTDGSVEEIGIARSSGYSRLDKAALEAVRRWRWSPTLVAGTPVQVRGPVDIPFVLRG